MMVRHMLCQNQSLQTQFQHHKNPKDVISKVVCAMCKKCLISVNHDDCLRNYVNDKNSRGKKQKAKVFVKEIQKKYQPKVMKPKKSWLWHQRLSHLNFDTINDLARNDLVLGLPKFKYHNEHLCPSCEQGKSNRASHPPKPVPNLRQRLHLLHIDLCGPMRITSINGKRKPDISFLYIFGALCYSKNDREDIGKLGAKGDIGFFIGSKPGLQSMTSGQINSALDLTYAPSTITTQQPTEGELDLLFEAMYDDYIGGQPTSTMRTVPPAQEPQVPQTLTASTTIADTTPTPTNSSFHTTNIPLTSQYVDELNSNAMVDGNTFVNPFANISTSAAESSSLQNAKPTEKHLKEVKRIFRYLWGTINTGLWYTKDSGFDLTGFLDADYAGCKDTFKSTSGGAATRWWCSYDDDGGGGKEMVMERRWLWRRDGEVDGGVVTPTVAAVAVGDDGDGSWGDDGVRWWWRPYKGGGWCCRGM
nr:retrovirus-related Pol polyprotein from transposon TNT 1-94 [Tanacetum cinerariifolium]